MPAAGHLRVLELEPDGGWPPAWPVWRRCGWRRRPAAPPRRGSTPTIRSGAIPSRRTRRRRSRSRSAISTTWSRTRFSAPATRPNGAPSTSTPSTRCRTRAGSPTGSGRGSSGRSISRRSTNGPGHRNGSGARAVDHHRAQGRRRHARVHDPRQRRRDLLDQVRPDGLPRDGQRRRGHLDQVLPRVRLSRRRELPGDAPRSTTCRSRRTRP